MLASLRLRLAIGALIAIAIALALVWAVLSHLFEDYLAAPYANEMTAVADTLGASLAVNRNVLVLNREPSDPRFQIPTGGRYWQISPADGQNAPRSRSLWDQEFSEDDLSKAFYCGFRQAEGPDGGMLLVQVHDMSIGAGSELTGFRIYTAFSKEEMDTAPELSPHAPPQSKFASMTSSIRQRSLTIRCSGKDQTDPGADASL